MMNRVLSFLAMLSICTLVHATDIIPGALQTKPIALVGGTVHPVTGPDIADGVVLFDGGKIVAVGKDIALPENVERVDVAGKHVYPGLFDALTSLGLVEINSVRGTVDEQEIGQINPNAQTRVAFNPDSELIPVTRSGGVLLALTAPSGGLIGGTSSVMQLDGWTWEDMAIAPNVAMHVYWPRMAPIHTWRLEETAEEQISNRDKSLAEIRRAVNDARAYWIARRNPRTAVRGLEGRDLPFDARWHAMIPVFERKIPVIVYADEVQQIQSAVAWAQQENFRIMIAGGYDAPRTIDLLKKYEIPVLVSGVYRLPQRRDDPYDTAFTVPAQLHEAGIRFCITGQGRMGNVRNLAYHAGNATAFGLPPDEALKSVTLYPAEILGLGDRLGSLSAGKDATLIVTTGDPLEIPTQVTMAFIEGRRVDLSDRQKRLWEKYQEKYRRITNDE